MKKPSLTTRVEHQRGYVKAAGRFKRASKWADKAANRPFTAHVTVPYNNRFTRPAGRGWIETFEAEAMRLAYMLLAKYVDLTPDGLFSLLTGGFSIIRTPLFPVRVPSLAVFARLHSEPAERGTRQHLLLVGKGPDGVVEGTPVMGILDVGQMEEGADESHPDVNCPFILSNLELKQPGKYTFELQQSNLTPMGSITLTIARIDGGAETAAATGTQSPTEQSPAEEK
jgi:hypothetical protein